MVLLLSKGTQTMLLIRNDIGEDTSVQRRPSPFLTKLAIMTPTKNRPAATMISAAGRDTVRPSRFSVDWTVASKFNWAPVIEPPGVRSVVFKMFAMTDP